VIWRGRREGADPKGGGADRLEFGHLLLAGFALSLDNLVVGFAFSFSRVSILLAAGTIAGVSVALALVGLELGQRLGAHVEAWSEELGGTVLVVVGLALGVGVLGAP
jgi:putative Mn2+ efflux pump MntP